MMMKTLFLALVVSGFCFAGCKKTTNSCSYNTPGIIAPLTEIDSLMTLLKNAGDTTTIRNTSGFFYTINQPGSGNGISNLCANITVTYRGYFFNGQTFDSTGIDSTQTPPQPLSVTLQLGQLIPGWQLGIPLIKKDGDITLYLPPSLAYGPNPATDPYGKVIVPGNSYLIFKIHILDIQ